MDFLESVSDVKSAKPSTVSANNSTDWERFSEWIHCVAVVTFDLERGQILEFCYPSHVELSHVEQTNICYLAFPDSNTRCMGDTQYCFRIRRTSKLLPQSKQCQRLTKVGYSVNFVKDSSFLYGFVYFRQVSDNSIKRGYYQKSVVLLTSLPYCTFFKCVLELMAPLFFNEGSECIKTACHEIALWPSPASSSVLELFLLEKMLFAPFANKQATITTVTKQKPEENAKYLSLHLIDYYQCFYEILPHVHILWELVLINEPLLVFASSPSICSSIVFALVSIINPLRYYCDFRPYFTIHDSEFKEFTSKGKAIPRVILGVTNPFFTKTLHHWPHLVAVGLNEGHSRRSSVTPPIGQSFKQSFAQRPGFYSKYKPYLKKDNKLIKAFLEGRAPGDQQNESALLQQHFLELTQSFMIPLERYIASLMPLQKSISPFKAPPPLNPFIFDHFYESVENSGPQLTSRIKGNWTGLYQRFVQSDNFLYWYRQRRREMKEKVFSLHLTALSEANLSDWCSKKTEVEVVDMVLRLRKKLRLVEDRRLELSGATVERLNTQISTIIDSLPADTRDILIKNKR